MLLKANFKCLCWIWNIFLILDVIVDGSRQLKIECKMALEEAKYYATSEHFKKCFIKPGDVQYLCNFAESPTNTTAINELFTISSDSTWGEGYSMGSLEASSALNSGLYELLQRKFNLFRTMIKKTVATQHCFIASLTQKLRHYFEKKRLIFSFN